ncbi:RP/EB family microtubule-associated protein [Capronia coronata CBS 617.96]|uniref:RP/EB family microtubule-associated protein n=1 Tax=Capronia coronata CBS 617.96 TaxID=1182541 RepID=W9XY57_9EURO|nr:RP/EB family microtubule-associated protein [Capronia coronata CBS 617.96]EXJ85457.1 RP/EB family microtubule-associated protein [Capronia coronata CBS 617.96]
MENCGLMLIDDGAVDIPMSRVKFNVNTEYAYIQNFKILQNCFTKHGIDRTVPVESLVKCKMQDNLEFLQWSKRFWDQYFPGHDYDAVARRKGAGAPAAPAPAAARTSTGTSTTRKPGTTPVNRTAPRAIGASTAGTTALKQENEQLKEAIAGLEKERDFYFSKLRDIELLLQTAVEQDPAIEEDENGLVKNIQAILYSTEEGFEIPDVEANGAEEPETF